MLSFIVAMDKNRVIGHNNDLPWHLPNDLQFFKKTTTGHTIIMGRKTFDSLGRVLPNRKHVVLTRSQSDFPEDVEVLSDIKSLLQYVDEHKDDNLFLIGGGNLFTQMLPYADRLYITEINEAFEGDVYFPEIDADLWVEVSRTKGPRDDRNDYDYDYVTYERK